MNEMSYYREALRELSGDGLTLTLELRVIRDSIAQ